MTAPDPGNVVVFVTANKEGGGAFGATLARAIKADPDIRDTLVVLLTSVSQWAEVR